LRKEKRRKAFLFCGATNIMDTTQGVDPFAMMSNAQDMLFRVISVIGFIWIGLAVFQIAMAFKSEDGTQKAKGFASLAGGILCAGVGVVVSLITGGAAG
jgi:hypothetical protein